MAVGLGGFRMETMKDTRSRPNFGRRGESWKLHVFLVTRKNPGGSALTAVRPRRVCVYAPDSGAALAGVGVHRDEQARPVRALPWEHLRVSRRVGTEELADFFLTLGASLGSGCSLSQALSMTARQALSPRFRGVIGSLLGRVSQGEEFALALSRFPEVFQPVHVALCRAAGQMGLQQSGVVLGRLALRLRNDGKLARKIAGAAAYPVFLLLLSAAAAIVLEFKALPPMVELFRSMGAPLPPITKGFYAAARFLSEHWVLASSGSVLGLLACAVFGPRLLRSDLALRLAVRTWPLGSLLMDRALARALSIFALLKQSGANTREIFVLSGQAAGNPVIEEFFSETYRRVCAGDSIEESFVAERHRLGRAGLRLAGKMEVGLETGELPSLLELLSQDFQERAETGAALLPRTLEFPLLLLCGLVVGAIMLAMFLPYPSLLGDLASQMRSGG